MTQPLWRATLKNAWGGTAFALAILLHYAPVHHMVRGAGFRLALGVQTFHAPDHSIICLVQQCCIMIEQGNAAHHVVQGAELGLALGGHRVLVREYTIRGRDQPPAEHGEQHCCI